MMDASLMAGAEINCHYHYVFFLCLYILVYLPQHERYLLKPETPTFPGFALAFYRVWAAESRWDNRRIYRHLRRQLLLRLLLFKISPRAGLNVVHSHSPVELGPSWAAPDPADASLKVSASADSGPETPPGNERGRYN